MTQHTQRKEFKRHGQGKTFLYTPFGQVYQLEGEKVMDCWVHEYLGGEGYGHFYGQIPMSLSAINNKDGLHV